MLSLYDYLGRAAGSELGLAITNIASKENIPVSSRVIENKAYKGEVNLYPKEFLDRVFTTDCRVSNYYKQVYKIK